MNNSRRLVREIGILNSSFALGIPFHISMVQISLVNSTVFLNKYVQDEKTKSPKMDFAKNFFRLLWALNKMVSRLIESE